MKTFKGPCGGVGLLKGLTAGDGLFWGLDQEHFWLLFWDLKLLRCPKQINLLKALFSGLGKKLPNSVTNLSKYWFDWVLDSKCFPSQPRVA